MYFLHFNISKPNIFFILAAGVYLLISTIIFYNVFLTSKMIVDEQFHIPLGRLYCQFNFSTWDPKVTTLPGVYLFSAAILGPFQLCSLLWLRYVNVIASLINIIYLRMLFNIYEPNLWKNICSAITLALLPPMYFVSHVYYTDVVSITMVLSMLLLYEKDSHFFASIFGMCAILCRQTNVIWVVFVAARYVMLQLYAASMRKNPQNVKAGIPFENTFKFMRNLRKIWSLICNMPLQFWLDFLSYTATLVTFALFLLYNGGIVVGDKSAHEAKIHLPQMFYFSIFCLIFAWPHFLGEIINFISFVRYNKLFISATIVVGLLIVHTNTLVHPYMLADNRHYIFYIWNRFYGKYIFFKYIMVPVYVFAFYVIMKTISAKNDMSLLLLYVACTTLVLIPQQLVEFRYYFIPYIIFRLHIKSDTYTVFNTILELVTYVLINFITFNLFFTKTIAWNEYSEPQRLMW